MIWSIRSTELGLIGSSSLMGEGNSHRDFAAFRYSRNTSTTAGGSTSSVSYTHLGSICVFYLLLMAIRGMVLLTEKRGQAQSEVERDRCRRRTFLISSLFLLALDLSLMLPIAMMVVLDKPVIMGLIPAIAMAAYTTWKITMASLHIN